MTGTGPNRSVPGPVLFTHGPKQGGPTLFCHLASRLHSWSAGRRADQTVPRQASIRFRTLPNETEKVRSNLQVRRGGIESIIDGGPGIDIGFGPGRIVNCEIIN